MTIYLVQCGATDWSGPAGQERMQGRISLPLSPVGQEQAAGAARRLAEIELAAVYSPDAEACLQTAKAVAAGHKGCKVRKLADLEEVNLGLWQGMLVSEVKSRHPRVYRQWLDEPASVTPPEGEGFTDAYQRVCAAVKKVIRRHGADSPANVVLVAPLLTAALVRCFLNRCPLSDIWKLVQGDPATPQPFSPPAEVEPGKRG